MMDGISIFGFVTSDTFTRKMKANMIENTENGMTVMNKNLHPRYSTMSPDNVGPSAGANMMTSPTIPMILRSEEHTSNSSHVSISYAVFCLKKQRPNARAALEYGWHHSPCMVVALLA